ncbi:uroporphyrinogen-III synthase [Acetobacter vaccinii]|uniref:Uroporphyrinogen-III synthase n=1 Tax=Acetobacter vaccinii TaxID=2592655 RepID=A0A5C1YN72_9PROT|nr:uroporphyrinogen-III synthase [Acetobacter vaccinii]QEO16537.1 uroporphyrinogen-III synthase [Acetobacter vaccinii]
MPARGVIVTRPEPGLSETLAAVQQAGWLAHASPSLRIVARQMPAVARTVSAVLVTSGQAVPAVQGVVPPDMPFYAVGARTAARLRQVGFATVQSADGNAEALAHVLCQHRTPAQGALMVLSGRGQGGELVHSLRGAGFRVIRRVVYDARPVSCIAPVVTTALEGGQAAAVLFFSARSAASWFAALPASAQVAARAVRAIVISPVVAQAVQALGWHGVVSVAASPDAAGMMAALGVYSGRGGAEQA